MNYHMAHRIFHLDMDVGKGKGKALEDLDQLSRYGARSNRCLRLRHDGVMFTQRHLLDEGMEFLRKQEVVFVSAP